MTVAAWSACYCVLVTQPTPDAILAILLIRTDVHDACRFVQIVLALWHVHSRNILHRDLKSQNIFVAEGKQDVSQWF